MAIIAIKQVKNEHWTIKAIYILYLVRLSTYWVRCINRTLIILNLTILSLTFSYVISINTQGENINAISDIYNVNYNNS